MSTLLVLSVVLFICGVLYERQFYYFQKIENAKFYQFFLHLLWLFLVGLAGELGLREFYNNNDFEPGTTSYRLAEGFFYCIRLAGFSVFFGFFGLFIVHQARLILHIDVPNEVRLRDKERERKIAEAKIEQEYKMREEEVGLVAEDEAENRKGDVDHEAELEDILKSRK